MALEVNKGTGITVEATEKLWRTTDDTLVPDGHPDAKILFCTPGTSVSRQDAERYGMLKTSGPAEDELVDDDPEDADPADEPDPADPEPEEKAAAPAPNKSRQSQGNKRR